MAFVWPKAFQAEVVGSHPVLHARAIIGLASMDTSSISFPTPRNKIRVFRPKNAFILLRLSRNQDRKYNKYWNGNQFRFERIKFIDASKNPTTKSLQKSVKVKRPRGKKKISFVMFNLRHHFQSQLFASSVLLELF